MFLTYTFVICSIKLLTYCWIIFSLRQRVWATGSALPLSEGLQGGISASGCITNSWTAGPNSFWVSVWCSSVFSYIKFFAFGVVFFSSSTVWWIFRAYVESTCRRHERHRMTGIWRSSCRVATRCRRPAGHQRTSWPSWFSHDRTLSSSRGQRCPDKLQPSENKLHCNGQTHGLGSRHIRVTGTVYRANNEQSQWHADLELEVSP